VLNLCDINLVPRGQHKKWPNRNKANQNEPSDLTSIGNIEFNAKISVGPARVVAGCQNDAANGFDFPDDAGHGWGGENAVLPDDQAADLNIEAQNKQL